MQDHKRIEQRRYDTAARPYLEHAPPPPPPPGVAGVPAEHRAPYEEFERHVARLAGPNAVVLDVGAGTGNFSLSARGEGRTLIAADISHLALLVARNRAADAGVPLHLVCADAERLPFRSGSIDVVTAAGALYCLDLDTTACEVQRVLRPAGAWVIVDSLDDSPVYRFNRWIGFLRRRRTALAVHNVPTTEALTGLRRHFPRVDLSYHGVLAFLLPLLVPTAGARRAGAFVSACDRRLGALRRWAFKVVVVARRSEF